MINTENIDNEYKDYYIKKNNNKYRHIQAPSLELKAEQYRILQLLKEKNIPISDRAHGFIENRDIFTNAAEHLQQECLFNIDLKDFFDGITQEKVLNKLNEYNIENSEYISKVVTRYEHLTQGAPTSPYLTNIIFYEMDLLLNNIAINNNLIYTRYADDMTFSGKTEDILNTKKEILNLIMEHGYKISWRKVNVVFKNQRREVTGIVINEKLNIKKPKVNKIRAICHCIERDIENNTIKSYDDIKTLYNIEVDRFKGYLNFLRRANPDHEKYYTQFVNSIDKILV